MYAFIKDFLSCGKLLYTHLELKVLPKHHTFALTGYVELKKYEPVENDDSKHEGEHSKQIKAFFKTLEEGSGLMIAVKTHPSMRMGKELSYEFSVGQKFASEAELQKEVELLRADGLVDEYTAPVGKKQEAHFVASDSFISKDAAVIAKKGEGGDVC